MRRLLTTLSITPLTILSSLAAEKPLEPTKAVKKQPPTNPIQPWSGYEVHDENRPHPAKVVTQSSVSIAAPADATILFDGNNAESFDKAWDVKDGILTATKSGNLRTKESFGSCQLHLEWRIPKDRKVKGQHGGNSGVFLMGLYEVQIQESHTNVTYPDGQAGAIYGQFPPAVNASRPQGEWQSYDILFTAPVYSDGKMNTPATMTVLHNGVAIHTNRILHGPTKYRQITSYPAQHPEKAPILFQWHGDPIEFKNIWVREISSKADKK